MSLEVTLLILAGAIILVLAVVAARLQFKVYQRRQEDRRRQEAQERAGQEQRDRVNRSIQILAQAVGNDDITLTEASIRITVLMDSMGVEDEVRQEFSAFYQLAEANADIPILDAWKQLSRKEQFAYDKQRVAQEAHFQEFVEDAAKRIQGRRF